MSTTRCRICWQPISGFASRCPRCGNADSLRVFNLIAERLLRVFAVAAVALLLWAIFRRL